jgi:ribosomal protein S18 acetylase RimI-like enzyme
MEILFISPLGSEHKKSKKIFNCDKPVLNEYIKSFAGQDIKRNLSACFVLENGAHDIIGYYTISNDGIPKTQLPDDFVKKLPYNSLPVTLLGRLAVDVSYKGKGYGEMLLMDALKKCYENRTVIASAAIIVDPIDENAIKFYAKYGFILLPDSSRMFLAMETLDNLF